MQPNKKQWKWRNLQISWGKSMKIYIDGEQITEKDMEQYPQGIWFPVNDKN